MSLFFEDFRPGQVFESGGRTITEPEIIGFAHSFDPQYLHIDRQRAEAGFFQGIIASGFQTLCIAWWLFLGIGLVRDSMFVGVAVDELRWPHPVRPGDTVRLRVEIASVTASSNPQRGKVVFAHTLENQDGTVVMTYRSTEILYRRNASPTY